MGDIHIQRIKNALRKLFTGCVDMSDYDGKPDSEKENAFLSRALASYSLTLCCDVEPNAAGEAVTDGFDDRGIDLIHFDAHENVLYLGQSKWIESGNGSIAQGDCQKFLSGCRAIVNLRLDEFNERVRNKETSLKAAICRTDVRIVLIFSYSGTHPLSSHVRNDIDLFLDEMNDKAEVFAAEAFDQTRIYVGIAGHAQKHAINLQIMLHDWGIVREPHEAYYGQVEAACVATWWREHGRRLFARNIRSFKGRTDVNESISTALRHDPELFWYFNNGITILCNRVKKQRIGGVSRESGVFECQGVNIVNGAQTVGVIGTTHEPLCEPLKNAKLLVRLISLENCREGFDKAVTRATNTQNRIDSRDFAALDPVQQRLSSEFMLDGRQYAYKSGDTEPAEDGGCSIVDATIALACDADIALAVQAKREIGRLWEDIEKEPYTRLFNERTNATDVWKAVQVMRCVERCLKQFGKTERARADLVAVHGNRLILHRVFRDPLVRGFRASGVDMEQVTAAAAGATETAFNRIITFLDERFPSAYLASFFKNANRCRELNDFLTTEVAETSPPTGGINGPDDQRFLFDIADSDDDKIKGS